MRRPCERPKRYQAVSELCRALVSVVAVCVAVAVCAGGASSSPSAGRGKLVLVGVNLDAADGAQAGLYVMNADGSGRRQITHNQSDEQPHWSPDGRSIAFLRGVGLTDRVIIVHADGTAPRSLGSSSRLAAPSPWSPDGKQIAWSGCRGLCIYDFRSSRRTRVDLGHEDWWGFAWSPDGGALAAVDQANRLVVVSTSGRILRVLAAAGQYPAWSPDGKQIAFLAGRWTSPSSKLEVVPAAGGRARVVARNAESAPSWSRDGHRLLYTDLIRHPYSTSVRVVNLATHTNTRVDETGGIASWSPDGATIAYGRRPFPVGTGQDLWIAQANGSGRRQLTGEFPTGIGYADLDWTSGRVPAGPGTSPPPRLLSLTAAAELEPGYLDGQIGRAETPDSVVYRKDVPCGDPVAEVWAATLNVWTPSSASTATTTTPCLDFEVDGYAVSSSLDAWIAQADLTGNHTVAVMRPGTTEAPPVASWTSGQEASDIGWRTSIDSVVTDGSMIVFGADRTLWRIADGAVVHATPVPLPPDATRLVDADNGRILVRTTSGFAVLSADGSVQSRVPASARATAQIGTGLFAVAAGVTLRVYAADSGILLFDLPLAHASGVPRLLTVGNHFAVYASGFELHLLQLNDGSDRIVDLPGQAGPLQSLLTPDGLFVAYLHGYDPKPARILFVPAANLP